MDGIIIILLFVSALFLLFLYRLWTFLSRHPLIRLLNDGVSLVVTIDDVDDKGASLGEPRLCRVYVQGRRNNRH